MDPRRLLTLTIAGLGLTGCAVLRDSAPALGPAIVLSPYWTCNGFVPVTYLIMPPWLRTRAG